MSRQPVAKSFTRNDIYAIRDHWDRRIEEGYFPYQIAHELTQPGAAYAWASSQTIVRIGKRETWKDIGLGPTERPQIAHRLRGEHKGTPAVRLGEIQDLPADVIAAQRHTVPAIPPSLLEGGELPDAPEESIVDILQRRSNEEGK